MAYRILALIFVLCITTSLSRAEDLVSILEQALLSDPRVRMSELQVEIGDAQDDQAYSQLMPSVTVAAQFSEIDRTDVDVERTVFNPNPNRHDSFPGERYSVSARQVLYNREALKNRKRTHNLLRQYGHELDDARASLYLDVGQKYLTVLGNEDNLALVRAEKDSVLRRLEQFEELYDKRLIRITDLLDAQVRRDQILADEIEVENSVLIAKEELRALTGTNVGELTPLAANATFPLLEGTIEYWVDRSIINSPALLARQKAVDAASAGLEQAKGRSWPTLDLQLSYLDSDTGFESARVNRTQTSSVAVIFNMPILTGGANWARAREARSQLDLEKMRREEAQRGIVRSVKEAYVTANSNAKRRVAGEAQVASANKAHEAMEQSFKYGTVTAVDVLEALQRKFEANRDLLRAEYSYLLTWLQLAYYSGELNRQQIFTINAMLQP